eukprot:GHVT01029897.1.p2 GENE.GHVT01029897.1~~GHVT01029897.1.p2  ORF type:complete len:118 (+),score=23.69 GHVT01029897.1:191-544(+)
MYDAPPSPTDESRAALAVTAVVTAATTTTTTPTTTATCTVIASTTTASTTSTTSPATTAASLSLALEQVGLLTRLLPFTFLGGWQSFHFEVLCRCVRRLGSLLFAVVGAECVLELSN